MSNKPKPSPKFDIGQKVKWIIYRPARPCEVTERHFDLRTLSWVYSVYDKRSRQDSFRVREATLSSDLNGVEEMLKLL